MKNGHFLNVRFCANSRQLNNENNTGHEMTLKQRALSEKSRPREIASIFFNKKCRALCILCLFFSIKNAGLCVFVYFYRKINMCDHAAGEGG